MDKPIDADEPATVDRIAKNDDRISTSSRPYPCLQACQQNPIVFHHPSAIFH